MPTSFEIFPAIGIARVGTSSEFFIGPEPDVPLDLRRRDGPGNLLKQAARFRIFRCDRNAAGKLQSATEITSADATIEWGVHLVNRKSAAERFGGGGRRNNATGNDTTDRDLIINPGLATIQNGGADVSLGGKFRGQTVPLGRLKIEASGRLLVLGGNGHSAASTGAQLPDDANFADNDDWHDDMGDGPVTASVTIGGQTEPVVGAWVIVAPPDFAPQIENMITLYDTLTDLAVQRGVLEAPSTVFYDRHVRPILERAMRTQWVNRQARLGYDTTQSGGHGPGGGGEFSLDALGDDSVQDATRRNITRLLRDPVTGGFPMGALANPRKAMPRLNDSQNSGGVLPLTRLQYNAMRQWAAENFRTTDPAGPPPELLPDALSRVTLEACVGGGFFPGIEAGRILLEAGRYMQGEAYRLSHTAVKPGEITARNAIPWQADFYACQWDEAPRLLAWWPAQRPDDVLVTADGAPLPWIDGLPDNYQGMVDGWHKLGFVKEDPANPGVFIEFDRALPPRPVQPG